MTEKLKPCPFCGAKAFGDGSGVNVCRIMDDEYDSDNITYRVDCYECGAEGWECIDRDCAIEKWNRRAPLTVADAMTVPEVRALVEAATDVTAYRGRTSGPEYLRVMVMLSSRVGPFLDAMKEESHE